MSETQLLKGILEGCVLSVIGRGETYGYEILSALTESGFDGLTEGTLYPVLTRLLTKGLVVSRVGQSPFGPKRRYLSLTPDGWRALADFKETYRMITAAASEVLAESDSRRADRG